MRRALAPFNKLESSNQTQSSADFITNTSGFSFRYTQAAVYLGLGVMASAALAALALGIVFLLDRGMLTVALALAAFGAAIVESCLSIPALRWAVAGLGLVVAGRLTYEPRIVGAALGVTPIFNWLLFAYGVPAAAFGLAARIMRRASGEDRPVQIAQALSVIFFALLFFFEIRHALNGGDPYSCRRWKGFVTVREHQALKWVPPKELRAYPMPPADAPLIPALIDLLD